MEFLSVIQLDQSISVLMIVRCYFSFFIQTLKEFMFACSGKPDQTQRFAAFSLVLH